MQHPLRKIESKIKNRAQALSQVLHWKSNDLSIVFTNGCFDLIHYGHLHYLAAAQQRGHKLVVGLNSADSVHRLKGGNRPINDDKTRANVLASLSFVDMVVFFEEDTPLTLIETILPDVLVKGGDYAINDIVGCQLVQEHGGKVEVLSFVEGYSTTLIEQKIKE